MTDHGKNASADAEANGDSRTDSPLPMLLVFVVLLALIVLYGVFTKLRTWVPGPRAARAPPFKTTERQVPS
jgi:hypothetical protein